MRLLAVFLLIFLCACQDQTSDSEEELRVDSAMVKNNKIIVYQIMTRLFGNTKSLNKRYGTIEENGVGKFNDISVEALVSLKELGITHVWFTGVLEHATMTDYSGSGIRKDHPEIVKGRAGSPYAIKDYYDVSPDLAVDVDNRLVEFQELLKRVQEQDLKTIIDFVPNHVAREYYSDKKPDAVEDLGLGDDTSVKFDFDNNFYYLPGEEFQVPAGYHPYGEDGEYEYTYQEVPAKVSGNDVFNASPSIHDWYETVKLNYGIDPGTGSLAEDKVPDTWNKMLEILSYWTRQGVDGFRCDMAQMVPVEFWGWVIPKIREINNEIIFIAEIYDRALYDSYIEEGEFDYLYDKVQLYDTLKHIMQGKGSTDNIGLVEDDLQDISGSMLRFLENHDEQRIASPYFAGSAEKGWPGMVVSATIGKGPLMVYFGQEVGEPGAGEEGFQGDDGRTTIFDYWGVPEHQKWMNHGKFNGALLGEEQILLRAKYKKLLNFTKGNETLADGYFLDLNQFNRSEQVANYSDKVSAYLRAGEKETLVIAANFSGDLQKISIRIPIEEIFNLDMNSYTSYVDVLTQSPYEMEDGLIEVELPANEAIILQSVARNEK